MENNTFIAKEQVNDFVSRLQDCLYELSIKLERANYMILNVEHEYFCDAVSCHKKNHGMELIRGYDAARVHVEIGSDYVWECLKEIDRMTEDFDMNKLLLGDQEKSL